MRIYNIYYRCVRTNLAICMLLSDTISYAQDIVVRRLHVQYKEYLIGKPSARRPNITTHICTTGNLFQLAYCPTIANSAIFLRANCILYLNKMSVIFRYFVKIIRYIRSIEEKGKNKEEEQNKYSNKMNELNTVHPCRLHRWTVVS